MTIVVPRALISSKMFMISHDVSGSRFPVGSSAITTFGSLTIERAIDKMKNDQSCNIGFLVEGESYTIRPVVGITLLRIIQEACNNAIKYAEADVIMVKMIYAENEVIITIEDDGKGFDAAYLDVETRKDNSGFGLSMMKERVYLLSGDIEIISKLGEGTKIKVVVPIYNKEEK